MSKRYRKLSDEEKKVMRENKLGSRKPYLPEPDFSQDELEKIQELVNKA